MPNDASSIVVPPTPKPFELPAHVVTAVIVPPEMRREIWGDGPWLTEPDRVDFEFAGLPCLLHRNVENGDLEHSLGNWCGYAAVPPGHPLHGLGWRGESGEGQHEATHDQSVEARTNRLQ